MLLGVLGGTPLVVLLAATLLAGDSLGESLQLLVALLIVASIIALVVWVVG